MTNSRLLENVAHWRKTKRGLLTNLYQKLKARNEVSFSLEQLHEFADCKKFNRLFLEWEKSKYSKKMKPSIDRISNKGIYELRNIQWLTWGENRYKQTMERRCRKGRVAKINGNKIVEIFKSQREAVLKTGLSQSNMSSVLMGKRNYCGGFKWAYVSNTEVIGNIYENKELAQ